MLTATLHNCLGSYYFFHCLIFFTTFSVLFEWSLIYLQVAPLIMLHSLGVCSSMLMQHYTSQFARNLCQQFCLHATGIYAGDDKVIHFTRGGGQEVGTGTVLDFILLSSAPKRSETPCPNCNTQLSDSHGVVSSCLDCFLGGGVLYCFKYAVSPALFLAKARGGTCTLAVSDPDDAVVKRANYLLSNGFRCYNVFKNNCEDFALYCKTGLLVAEQGVVGQSGQAVSIVGGPLAAVLSTPLRLLTTNIYGMAVTAVGVYCASRYIADIGNRRDVLKVEVEDLTAGLATGRVQLVEEEMRNQVALPMAAHS